MLAILVVLVLVVMAEAIYKIVTYVIPLTKVSDLSFLIEEIATLFILLEIILMLLRYVKVATSYSCSVSDSNQYHGDFT